MWGEGKCGSCKRQAWGNEATCSQHRQSLLATRRLAIRHATTLATQGCSQAMVSCTTPHRHESVDHFLEGRRQACVPKVDVDPLRDAQAQHEVR